MMFGQARSRSVLMGLDNHMITSTVPALLSGAPCRTTDMTPRHSRDRRTGPIPITQCPCFYTWHQNEEARQEQADEEEGLARRIREIHTDSRGACGALRITRNSGTRGTW